MNEAHSENGRGASAPRILVVEDEADLALLLSYNLEAELGFRESAVSSSRIAKSCCLDHTVRDP